ncbi:hypothetical protein C0989_007733, partial [Termitomyces sp. Mn162]
MPHANTLSNKSSSKHITGNKKSGWESFLTALKLSVMPHAQHGKELTGPLKPFYNAGKLIPWVVNPFLKLNAVFMHGLVMDALLNVSFLGPGVNDTPEELTKKEECAQQLNLNAYNVILTLEPLIEPTLKQLCEMMDGEEYHEKHAEKHATKRPIASRLNIKNIMAETIAYTACQLHFALSSTSQWGMQDGLFSLLDFDYNITALFSPSSQWAEETLASWD